MPKKLPEDLNARIQAEIARHREGIGIDDLHAAQAGIVSRRTLQRRLGMLADQKQIAALGDGKARAYQALGSVAVTSEQAAETGTPAIEVYVPISSESRDIFSYVRLPIQQRKTVGMPELSWSRIVRTRPITWHERFATTSTSLATPPTANVLRAPTPVTS